MFTSLLLMMLCADEPSGSLPRPPQIVIPSLPARSVTPPPLLAQRQLVLPVIPAQARTMAPADRLPPASAKLGPGTVNDVAKVINWRFRQEVDDANWNQFNRAVTSEQAKILPGVKKEFLVRMLGDGAGQPLVFDQLIATRKFAEFSIPSKKQVLLPARQHRDVLTTGTICVTRDGVFPALCDEITVPPPLYLTTSAASPSNLKVPGLPPLTMPSINVWDRPHLLPRQDTAPKHQLGVDLKLLHPWGGGGQSSSSTRISLTSPVSGGSLATPKTAQPTARGENKGR